MSHDTSEKAHGTTSCAYSCAVCGEAEQDFPTSDEREIDRLRWRIDRAIQWANGEREKVYADASKMLGRSARGLPTPFDDLLAILEGREP